MNPHKNFILIFAISFAGFFLLPTLTVVSGAAEADDSQVLATVDGESITMADLNLTLAAIGNPKGQSRTTLSPETVLRRLIQNRLLEQEGYRIAADERPDVKTQVTDLVEYKAMITLMDSVQASVKKPDPAEMDSLFAQGNTMHRLSHILVSDEGIARALLDSLEAGTLFADLAKLYSEDTTSIDGTGDLGWAKTGSFVPEFQAAVAGLSKGEVAGPVKTMAGWHLVMLADIRTETLGQSDRMQQAVLEAIMKDRVMTTMREYIASLKEKHGIVVNTGLLSSLDYASSDLAIVAEQRSSEAVLAELPHRNLTVRGLTYKIRFKYFHGTEGKEDADAIRDQMFDDWLVETLLTYEAMERGYQNQPEIVAQALSLERQLLREAVLDIILAFPFEPTPDEVESYYEGNKAAFTSSPKVKVQGVILAEEEAAIRFREKLKEGAGVAWLAKRDEGVIDPDPKALSGWLNAEDLGVAGEDAEKGTILGPFRLGEEWAVAKIVSVGSAETIPLDECRKRVVRVMHDRQRREALREALDKLQSQGNVETAANAEEMIELRVSEWLGASLSSAKQ